MTSVLGWTLYHHTLHYDITDGLNLSIVPANAQGVVNIGWVCTISR
eukprot:CAMPEP_0201620886 /NCGR_PEP_ID=MMETSP0492-20130828/45310_1 /ASSEMBLY_ACC=CAM_ASM_000837 /TAXON_ID=420259 /ORGANISM="Thalassiosira gravida, Strain GMp14c1" /LENGTH=45 /DNA_ID= /DNA_START= /DNA_END= /DNA_ORIENTATION=